MKRKTILIIISILTLWPVLLFAQTKQAPYTLLEPLGTDYEGGGTISKFNLATYVDTIIKIAISLAALLAVIQIVIAGLMYVSAGGNSSTIGQARTKIWDALIGLLIACGFYVILWAINPDMLKIDNIIPQIGDVREKQIPTTDEVIKKGTVTEIPSSPNNPSGQKTTIDEINNTLKKYNKTLVEGTPVYDANTEPGSIDRNKKEEVIKKLETECKNKKGVFGLMSQFPGIAGITGSGSYYVCVKDI